MKTRTFLLLSALLASFASPGLAQTASDKAAAEALFESGRTLLQAGNYAQACPKFEASQKLDSGLGTLLYLGECYEKMGKLASAWATFREAESLARGRGDQERASVAQQRAATLLPRLSRVLVAVAADNPADTVVKWDGTVVPRATWGLSVPVDAGSHTLEASAPGRETFSREVRVPGDASSTQIQVPTLGEASAPVAAPTPLPVETAPDEQAEPQPGVDDGSSQRTSAIIVGAVGLGGLALGTVFGLQAKSKNDDSKGLCRDDDENLCSQAGVDQREDAQSAALVSTISFGVGAAALAAGAILYFTAPSAPPDASVARRRGLRVSGGVTRDGAAVTLGGHF